MMASTGLDRLMAMGQSNLRTLASKFKDYGPGTVNETGQQGVVVRAFDKLHRIRNLQDKTPGHESVVDSWLDLANYGLIGAAKASGAWPEDKPRHPVVIYGACPTSLTDHLHNNPNKLEVLWWGQVFGNLSMENRARALNAISPNLVLCSEPQVRMAYLIGRGCFQKSWWYRTNDKSPPPMRWLGVDSILGVEEFRHVVG